MPLITFGPMAATRDKRTWNDAQLQQAVAASRSWRAVARELGLKATSAGVIRTVKRHAARLDLDTAHFTGQRRWSDSQLRRVMLGATCWADVLTGLGVIDNGENRVRVKGHSARLGLDCTHLKTPQAPPAAGEVFEQPFQPEMLRYAASAVAMAWFSLRGCAVALPIEPQEYDLLVTTDKGIQRVQVKTCGSRNGKGRWHVGVGRRPYVLDKSAGKMPYDPDSLDLFFILLGDGSIYLIPSAVLAGRVAIDAENYAPYRIGDASSLLRGASTSAQAPRGASAHALEFLGLRPLGDAQAFAFDVYLGG
ncbi:group I intron-associated PD-(D/E)XK endonuclease [Kribbella sp. NPDC026596]|uniref:group I intron-associated PD-(D/E)XK endonuclease n=1 Tax=Kribbella sp. NPDC026596 TaxID=3155122 RepID=UPI00340BE37D